MPNIQLQFRRGTSTEWSNANAILADGELAIETNTRNFKIGNGSTVWNSLSYGGILGPQGVQGPQGWQGFQGFQGPQGVQGPQGNQGRTGPTGPIGSTFTTFNVIAGSAVITSPTSINLLTTGDAVRSVEYLESTSEGIYFQCALPAVTAANTLIIGIITIDEVNPYSIFLTNTNSYELYYIGGATETGTYTPGDIFSIYLDGSSVFFKLNGIILNAPLSISHGIYRSLIIADTASQTYAISNIRFYPTGKRGPGSTVTGFTGYGAIPTMATGGTGLIGNSNLVYNSNTNMLTTGALTLSNGYRPLYSNVTTTSLSVTSNLYGLHYNITNSGFTTMTLPSLNGVWDRDSNAYWVFRNNTSSYLSITVTYQGSYTTAPTNPLVIPPSNSTTIMVTYPLGASCNYVLF